MNWLTLIAAGIAFIIGVVLARVFIPVLKKMKFGQQVREDGPQAHLKKSGVPTMGGICIVIAMIVGMAIFIPQTAAHTVPVAICTVLFALIGFLDDFLKIKKAQSEGLKAWQKMALQIILMVALMLYVALGTENGTATMIPFYGMVDLKGWFYPIAVVAILGTVNGANFTDGLDGLASSVTIVIALFFTIATAMLSGFLDPASLAMVGALAAFLVFNRYPAKIFMGDTGSLALGGYVAAEAFLLKMPIMLILVAFIYLVEIISVILQVGYFKLTHGKRLFRMAPIHHHFELGGWSEKKIVFMFTVITLVLSIIAVFGIR